MAHVQPWDPHANPLDAMLRYLAVGVAGYDFHPHSNHEHVIAEDGSLMKGASTVEHPAGNCSERDHGHSQVAYLLARFQGQHQALAIGCARAIGLPGKSSPLYP